MPEGYNGKTTGYMIEARGRMPRRGKQPRGLIEKCGTKQRTNV